LSLASKRRSSHLAESFSKEPLKSFEGTIYTSISGKNACTARAAASIPDDRTGLYTHPEYPLEEKEDADDSDDSDN
jgi:hypothetical protein